MTFNELNKISYDISHKVRHFRTFAMILNTAVLNTHSIESRNTDLPELEDITELAFLLADQAEDAVANLLDSLPCNVKGITP